MLARRAGGFTSNPLRAFLTIIASQSHKIARCAGCLPRPKRLHARSSIGQCRLGLCRSPDMNFSELFIRRPVATSLLMAAVAFVGMAAFPFLPVASLPQID